MKVTQKDAIKAVKALNGLAEIDSVLLAIDILTTGKGKYEIISNKQTLQGLWPREALQVYSVVEALQQAGYTFATSMNVSRGRLMANYELMALPSTNGKEE